MPKCPICRSATVERAKNPTAPFCSERCKLIDLGNWLGESYSIPDGAGLPYVPPKPRNPSSRS